VKMSDRARKHVKRLGNGGRRMYLVVLSRFRDEIGRCAGLCGVLDACRDGLWF
jgi:hypothetical protein